MSSRWLVVAATLLLIEPRDTQLLAGEPLCESEWLCPEFNTTTWCMNSRFWLEAESTSGAQGDVVGVTFSLHFTSGFDLVFNGIDLVVCHDSAKAEIVGEPVYADEFLARNPLVLQFVPVQEDSNPRQSGNGFYSSMGVITDRSLLIGEIPLMTMYYRLLGEPGQTSEISFCDGEFLEWGPGTCNFSGIYDTRNFDFPSWPLLSTRNRNGTLTVLEGPTTRPDRPPEPPTATVYPEAPASDEVDLGVRIESALAVPGDRDVPVEVYVTAEVEYTGMVIPIDFDERYLRVARVEDRFITGAATFDNQDALEGAQTDEGYLVIASSVMGTRRIAAAGEEFHAATIYFDVLEAAAGVSETRIEPRPVGGRAGNPFVVVRHLSGAAASQVEVRGEFGVVRTTPGVLALRSSPETLAGDANFDGAFDITDPVSVLGYLFMGDREPLCPPAADFDADGDLRISDPIRMLGALFQGEASPGLDRRVQCR